MVGPRTRVLALAFVLAATGPAFAEDTALDLARHDVESSDYLAARGALVSALDAGTAGPAELAEIYKLSGIVDGALGETDKATAAFVMWLSLDPKGALPAGTSPKIMRPFEAAAAKVKEDEPIKVRTETSADPPSVTLVVQNDPARMIVRARVFVRADGKSEVKVEGSGSRKITLELPPGKRLDLRVQGLDIHGNRVVELGSTDVPIVITGAEPQGHKEPDKGHHEQPKPVGPPPEPRPLYLKWWAWAGVGAVFLGAGTFFGFEARSDVAKLDDLNAHSSDHQFTETGPIESRARREVLFFDIGMGAAGVFALGATVLYLTEPKITTETRVTAVPAPGGAAVVVGGRF